MNTPRIYVACLAAYNAGRLHGRWIEVDGSVEHLQSEIQSVLAESPIPNAEEFAIHDSEYFGARLHRYESIEDVCALAELIEEYGDAARAAFGYFSDVEEVAKQFEDGTYCGSFSSTEEWAEYYWESTGMLASVPESLHWYIDLERWVRDSLINDFLALEEGDQVHIFSRY